MRTTLMLAAGFAVPALAAPCFGPAVAFDTLRPTNEPGATLNYVSDTFAGLTSGQVGSGGSSQFLIGGTQGEWPDTNGVPFALADDSVISVSKPGAAIFPGDQEAVFGQNRDPNDYFWAVANVDDFIAAFRPLPRITTWTFDISGATDLFFALDLGQFSDDDFQGITLAQGFEFEVYASIDGGPESRLFQGSLVAPAAAAVRRPQRPFDDGDVAPDGEGNYVAIGGPNTIYKIDADTGELAAPGDVYMNKASSATGMMDTFVTMIPGTGSQITLRFENWVAFEAWAIDNISIYSGFEPECTPDTCPGDFVADGVKNVFDILAFFDLFGAGDESADIDENGSFDVFDILGFFEIFTIPCEG